MSFSHFANGRRGHLKIAETRAETVTHALCGDALLLTSSWERRCTEICSAELGSFDTAAVIRFADSGKSGRRAEHDLTLAELGRKVTTNLVDLPSLEVHDFFGWRDALAHFIVATKDRLERPIDLVVDMTCLPKYYLLLILGFCVNTGVVRAITFFYAEGQYAPGGVNMALAADHAFTQGEWTSFPVPYLEGELNPDRKIRVLASIGFETFQARKIIRAYEAERHILITPNPGFAQEYEDRSEVEALALASNLDVSAKEMVRARAGGIVETSASIIAALDTDDRYNDVGLCLGTKPHALAMGIAAQLRSRFTLVCRLPEAYVESDTPAMGQSWVYTIEDLSAGSVGSRLARVNFVAAKT